VRFGNTITDFDQTTLIDPDTHEIKIYDSRSVLKDTITNPTRLSLGVFQFYYTIPEDGEPGTWRMEWKVTKNTLPSRGRFEFPVAA